MQNRMQLLSGDNEIQFFKPLDERIYVGVKFLI